MTSDVRIPDSDALATALTEILIAAGEPGVAAIERRERNWYTSSFPSELVSVRLRDASRLTLFCKYGESYIDSQTGLRRGPAFEAEVYTYLRAVGAPVARCHGACTGTGSLTYLVLEFLDGAARLNKLSAQAPALLQAATALGSLHRRTELGRSDALPEMNRYDRSHFETWLSGVRSCEPDVLDTAEIVQRCHSRDEIVAPLVESSPVLVHGELYPSNILIRGSATFLIDWETAGIGAGEIDLATLLLGWWPSDAGHEAEVAYAEARWPSGPPVTHDRALRAARIYALATLLLREARQAERRLDLGWAYDELRAVAVAAGA